MILGEFGPIFSDTLFTQTARNRTIDINYTDLTRVRGTFLKFEGVLFRRKEGFSSLVRDHYASTTSMENLVVKAQLFIHL